MTAIDRDFEGVLLTEVAQLDGAAEDEGVRSDPLLAQGLGGLLLELGEGAIQIRQIEVVEQRDERAGDVLRDVGIEHAPRRERGRRMRHDHLADPHLAGEQRGEQRTGAAEGEQREVSRIVAALDRDLAHGADGPGQHHVEHAGGGASHVDAERPGDPFLDPPPGRVGVDDHLASQEPVRVEVAEVNAASVTVGSTPPLP